MTGETTSDVQGTQQAARGATRAGARTRPTRAGRWKLLALVLLLASPVFASFIAYYVVRPDGRTNYGTLLEQRPIDALAVTDLGGQPAALAAFQGRWVMVVVAPSTCDASCRERLYQIRQVRLTTGKDRQRVERLWLVEDAGAPEASLLGQHEGLVVLRAPAEAIAARLPALQDTRPSEHIWLIDPRGHLMMRFPSGADPSRIKKDLAKLLRASQIG